MEYAAPMLATQPANGLTCGIDWARDDHAIAIVDGNKDDRFDAFVLADTLRTDRARLRPLVPDSPATTALRATCRARRDLVAHRWRWPTTAPLQALQQSAA